MGKLILVATSALLMLGGALQAQAQAYSGYAPPPVYAYGAPDQYRAQDEVYGPGGCRGASGFTLLGARGGVTVLGFDAGIGGHLSFNAGGCAPAQVVRAPAPVPQPQFAPQQPQPMYAPQPMNVGQQYYQSYYAPYQPQQAPMQVYAQQPQMMAPPCGCQGY